MPQALLDSRKRERTIARLAARYDGVHSPERVRETVDEIYSRFTAARVQTYVPLLVERAAVDLLDTGRTRDCAVTRPVRSERGQPG